MVSSKGSKAVARVIVASSFLIFRALKIAISSYQNSKFVAAGPAGSFAFQDNDKLPEKDSEGRVIVHLEDGGEGFEWRVNIKGLRPEIALELAGEVTPELSIERRLKVRFRPDKTSEYDISVWVETLDGEQIGWLWAECSQEATDVMNHIDSNICKVAPFLNPYDFSFEATAEIEGHWWIGGLEDEPRIDYMDIQIKDPVVVEIY